MRALAMSLVLLLAGCSSAHHVGDCFRCAEYVGTQDQVRNAAQTQVIYGVVQKALVADRVQSAAAHKSLYLTATASVAPVRSTS